MGPPGAEHDARPVEGLWLGDGVEAASVGRDALRGEEGLLSVCVSYSEDDVMMERVGRRGLA